MQRWSARLNLYNWQTTELDEAAKRKAIFAAPRLGKTRLAVALLKKWDVKRAVIVAPLSVCGAWVDEALEQGYHWLKVPLLYKGRQGPMIPNDQIAVINYDKLTSMLPYLMDWKPEAVIFDESHLLKNPQSQRSKAARKLARRTEYVRLLTGTPSPNHYGDLWAQMTIVDEKAWGKYTDFKRRYLICHPIYPSKVLGHDNVEELQAKLNSGSAIVRREDVFGPDHYQVVERWLDMPPKAREAYDTLVREWILRVEQGEVLADHALKRLIRLQQITSGYLRTEDEADVHLHSEKIDAVLADLDEIVESGEKAVIFHKFTWEGEQYEQALAREFPNVPVWRIYGGTSPAARAENIRLFRDTPGAAVMVAQVQAAGVGVSFAEATHALFVSQSFSFTDETQARDRIYKPGERRVVTYYRVRDSVDEFVASVIASKSDVHNSVTRADIEEMAYGKLKR